MSDRQALDGRGRWVERALAVLLALVVSAPLLPAVFSDASVLAFDNRLFPPLRGLLPADAPGQPARPHGVDMNGFVAPEALRVVPRLRELTLPLWNERQLLGVPEAAGPWAAPDHLLGLVVGPLRGLALSAALHLAALAVGAWVWLRQRGHGRAAAWVGALVISSAAWPALHVHRLHFLQAFAWTPWLALAARRLLAAPDARGLTWLALAVAGALLAGAPPIAALALLAAAVDVLGDLLRHPHARRVVAAGVLAAVLGAGLAAPVLLPARAALSTSVRGQGGGPGVTPPAADRLPAVGLATLLLPNLFDDERQPGPRDALAGRAEDNPLDRALHLGSIPLALLLVALLRGARPRRDVALLGLALACALGLPPFAALVLQLPGTPRPDRALALLPIAAAGLVARGTDELLRGATRALVVVAAVFVLFSGLAIPALAAWLPAGARAALRPPASSGDLEQLGVAGLTLLACALLVSAGHRRVAALALAVAVGVAGLLRLSAAVPPSPLTDQYTGTPSMALLAQRGPGRLVGFQEDVLPAALAQLHGVSSLGGYHPLVPERTAELVAAIDPSAVRVGARAIGPLTDPAALASPLLDLLGVRWVATGAAGVELLESAPGSLVELGRFPDELVSLWERPSALPPAWFVSTVERVDDRAARLARLGDRSFEPRAVAFVEQTLDLAGPLAAGPIGWARPSPERIELTRVGRGPAFAVLSESWDPGWSASAENTPVALVVADHGLIGLSWPPGAGRVTLVYDSPPGRRAGLVCAALAAALWIVLVTRRGPRRATPIPAERAAAALR